MGLVGRVWAEIGGDASGLKNAANEAKTALNGIKGESIKTSDTATNALLGITSAAALLTTAIFTAKKAFDFSAEGAEIVSLKQASNKLAANYGSDMTKIVSAVKSASFNTITEYDIMKGANLAMTMGITNNANEMAQLMQIAIERGRAFGLTTEDAFDRITRGIGRRSTKVLDDIGFTADAITANKEYAKSLGVSTDALTDNDKVRALFLQILKEGNAELSKQGGLLIDISTPYQHVSTVYKELLMNAKEWAAYGGLPFVATPKQIESIGKQDAAISILTGSYEDYTKAMINANSKGIVNGVEFLVSPEVAKKKAEANGMLTKTQFSQAQSLTAQANAYKGLKTQVKDYTTEEEQKIDDMRLEAGLSDSLSKSYEAYQKAMEKAGKSTKKQEMAINDLNESYQDFIMSTLSDLGVDSKTQMGIAFAFGEIDANSLAAFDAISKITTAFQDGKITADQYYAMLQDIPGAVKQLQGLSADIPITLRVNVLINGVMSNISNATALAAGLISQFQFNKAENIAGSGGMHGGSFVGMAHGGMVVPPGFSNDGMMVRVSSGERLDVTPAGNKSVSGQSSNTLRFYGPVTFKIDKDIKTTDLMTQLKQ